MALQTNKKDAWLLRQLLHSSTAAVAILVGGMNAALADETLDGSLAGLAPISSEELSTNRGGFSVGPVNFSFAFTLTTTATGGALGQSTLSITNGWTPNANGNLTHTGTTVNAQGPGAPDLSNLGKDIANKVAEGLANGGSNGSNSNGSKSGLPAALDAVSEVLGALPAQGASQNQTGNNNSPPPPPNPTQQAGADAAAGAANVVQNALSPPPPPIQELADAGHDTQASSPPPPPIGAQSLGDLAGKGTDGIVNAQSPPPPPPSPGPDASQLAAPDLPASPPASPPAPQSFVSIDPVSGNIAVGLGGTTFLVNQHGLVLQNTENNVQISSVLSANFTIENYHDIAALANMHQQLSDIAQQLLSIQTLIRH